MRAFVSAGLLLGVCCGAFGQSPPSPRTFEVASIKPHLGPVPRIGVSTSGPRLAAEALSVRGLILYAYDLKNYQLPSTPPLLSLGDTMYDVVAKAPGEGVLTKSEFRQMMQSMLADRFRLRVHHEMKEMLVYGLVAAKNGHKLKEAGSEADAGGQISVNGRNNVTALPKATMDSLVAEIANSAFLDRPVLNQTGLTGVYNIRITYTPEYRMGRGAEPDLDVSIFTALQEQLGLRLAPQKADVEVLVVDQVEKPTDN